AAAGRPCYLQPMPTPPLHIFVAWDSDLKGVRGVLEGIIDFPPPGVVFDAIGYKKGDPHVGSLRGQLTQHIHAADGLLAVVDKPNAYVGWEIGYALGLPAPALGPRRLALVRAGQEKGAPAWIAYGPLREELTRGRGVERGALESAAGVFARWTQALGPCATGGRSLLLCPNNSTGSELIRYWRTTEIVLDVVDPAEIALTGLLHEMAGAGRAVWVVPEPGEDQGRHAEETARLAIVAGFLDASGVPVTILRHEGAEEQKHLPGPEPFGSNAEFVEQLVRWDERTRPGPGGAPPAPLDLIAAWRRDTQAEHADLLPFVRDLGHRLLQQIPVEIELERDAPFACLDPEGGDGCAGHRLAGGPGEGLPLRALVRRHLNSTPPDTHAGRWLVVAEPGAGKTTLARHLAWELAGEGAGAPIPVFASLATLAERDEHPFAWAGRTLSADQGHLDAGTLERDLFAAGGERGRVWLLLDGLDEVPGGRLVDLWKRIGGWAEALPGAVVVVLTRPVAAQQDRPLPKGFCRVAVRHLDDTRQRALVASLLEPALAQRVRRELLCQPQLGLLARNPLLLTLLAIVAEEAWAQDEVPPSHRIALYDRAVTLFLERDWGRGGARVRDAGVARHALRSLALHLQIAGGEAWPREVLEEALWPLRRQDDDLDFRLGRAWPSHRDFLDDLDAHAGLLGARDGRRAPWRFLHRSFREFLAAEALARRAAGARLGHIEAFFEGKRERDDIERFALRWGEVLAMLCGLVPEEEARSHLGLLERAAPDVAMRALPSLERVGPAERLAMLVRLVEKDVRFDPEHLDALATGLRACGEAGERALRESADAAPTPLARGLAAGLLPEAARGGPVRGAGRRTGGRPAPGDSAKTGLARGASVSLRAWAPALGAPLPARGLAG
ncbi:MAG: NACHT domain-containing protein, partial [Pseudomonadota bacterium]